MDYISLDDNSILEMNSKDIKQRNLKIELPNSVRHGNYSVIITAISITNDNKEMDSHSITVKIADTGINDIDNNGTGQKSTQGSNDLLIILVGIIIVIIILISIFFIYHRKKRLKQETLSQGSMTIKPDIIPTKVISQDQVSGQSNISLVPNRNVPINNQPIQGSPVQSNYLYPETMGNESVPSIVQPVVTAPQLLPTNVPQPQQVLTHGQTNSLLHGNTTLEMKKHETTKTNNQYYNKTI